MTIVERDRWGFPGWTSLPHAATWADRTEFFVHYDGGHPVERTGYDVPRHIDDVHRDNGWSGIGYNFVVDQQGNVYEGRGWLLVGAHCPGHNRSGIGVQVAIGGAQQPSPAALNATRRLYDLACRLTGRNLAKRGHRDGYATACPGDTLQTWVNAGMPATTLPDIPEDDMPSLAEITAAVKAAIPNPWSYGFGRGDNRKTAGQLLGESARDSAAALAAVRALAAQSPDVDEAAVERLIAEAAERVRIDISVIQPPQ